MLDGPKGIFPTPQEKDCNIPGRVEIMPVPGYKSITFSSEIYDKLFKQYTKNKTELSFKGISSFSAFVTSLLSPTLLEK